MIILIGMMFGNLFIPGGKPLPCTTLYDLVDRYPTEIGHEPERPKTLTVELSHKFREVLETLQKPDLDTTSKFRIAVRFVASLEGYDPTFKGDLLELCFSQIKNWDFHRYTVTKYHHIAFGGVKWKALVIRRPDGTVFYGVVDSLTHWNPDFTKLQVITGSSWLEP